MAMSGRAVHKKHIPTQTCILVELYAHYNFILFREFCNKILHKTFLQTFLHTFCLFSYFLNNNDHIHDLKEQYKCSKLMTISQ